MTTAALHSHGLPDALRADNITLPQGAGQRGIILAAAGILLVAAGIGLLASGTGGGTMVQALASFHAAATGVLGVCLSGLIFLMIFNVLNAGWVATLRRLMENIVSFVPIAWALAFAVPVIDYFQGGRLFAWMNPANYGDTLLIVKFVYFFGHMYGAADAKAAAEGHSIFPLFFVIRAVFFLAIWTYLARRIASLSREQDQTGDIKLSAKARFTSSWGIPVVALTMAFAGFDLLKSLDYRFFSTMWGVYYFAGGSFGFFFLTAAIASRLRARGKLQGAVTEEHFHDLGKLMFSFTVFWAYIGFSQYFLIWYSNIPEETSYFVFRKQGFWNWVGIALCVGHFFLPFFFLISRHIKKNMALMRLVGIYGIAIHLLDMYWIIRPMALNAEAEAALSPLARGLDFVVMAGVVLLFAGYIARKNAAGPLVAVNDPYMGEALHHKNYV